MPDYQLGKIYKLISDQTEKIYIGSTCQKYISYRLSGHKADFENWKIGKRHGKCSSFELLNYDDVQVILLENYPCNSKAELEARERYYIEQNKEIVINKIIPTRTPKEYREENKETRLEKKRLYHHAHKKECNEKSRNYYETHKEEQLQKQKERYDKDKDEINKKRRERENTPEFKEKKKAQDKAYYEKLKAKKQLKIDE